MIKAILFVLFFILLAVAILGIVLFAVKSHKVQSAWDDISTPNRWGETKKIDPEGLFLYSNSFL